MRTAVPCSPLHISKAIFDAKRSQYDQFEAVCSDTVLATYRLFCRNLCIRVERSAAPCVCFYATSADTVLLCAQDALPDKGLVNRQPLAPVQVGDLIIRSGCLCVHSCAVFTAAYFKGQLKRLYGLPDILLLSLLCCRTAMT